MRIEGDYDEVHWYGEVRVDGRPLDPGPSLKVRNHSPDGFAWGYAGSGPAQLALAVLLAAGVPEPQAAEHYQEFKREFVERLDRSRFALDVDLDDWLRRKGAGRSRLLAQAVLDPSRVQRPVDTSSLSAWAEGILARLADVLGTALGVNDNELCRVSGYNETPDIRCRGAYRSVDLERFRDALPEVVN